MNPYLTIKHWIWRNTPRWIHRPITWLFHGLVVVACVLVGTLLGLPKIGFMLGFGFYLFKEIWELLDVWPDVDWLDKAGDIGGPIVLGLLVLWVVA